MEPKGFARGAVLLWTPHSSERVLMRNGAPEQTGAVGGAHAVPPAVPDSKEFAVMEFGASLASR